jgi:hypothetical protein
VVHRATYEDAVYRLLRCGYEVRTIEQGYLVCNLIDPSDVSHCYNLVQLVDLADLVEWREQRKQR